MIISDKHLIWRFPVYCCETFLNIIIDQLIFLKRYPEISLTSLFDSYKFWVLLQAPILFFHSKKLSHMSMEISLLY